MAIAVAGNSSNPAQPALERRALEDFLRLGMKHEALELLEADRLKPIARTMVPELFA